MKFDKAVEKSLYDKTTESFVYNPTIVVNENKKSIKDKITENLKKADQIDIAVSYVVWSGLSLIYKELMKFDNKSRILITTEGLVTDPRSLRKLLELDLSVKVYNPYLNSKGFHLKSFSFTKDDDRTLLIGSNNISARAFGLAHEMAVEINSKKEGYIIEKYNNVFQSLWNDKSTVELDEEFINNYTILFEENREFNNKVFEIFNEPIDIKPNYMQEQALIKLEETRQSEDRGLVIAATGTGKTYLAAFDVKQVRAKRVLFLVHNRIILSDAKKTFKNIFPNKNMMELFTENFSEFYNNDFIFTTDRTATNLLLDQVDPNYFDYVIYDEAHRIGEHTQYNDLIDYFIPEFTLGITATPERTDDPKFLFEKFKYSVPYEIRLLDSLEHELVCPFTYYGLDLEQNLLETDEIFDYKELSKYLKRNIDEKGYYGEKLRALVFCSSIAEAKSLNKELNNIGYKSEVAVSGSNITDEKIKEYIEDLKSSDQDSLEIICTVNKFNEGVDIPDVNMIIMLRNTTSSIIYLQQLGRGLRRTKDPHKYVTVLDIIGNSKNNYTIAEVLTGGRTVDRRELYKAANQNFNSVSPFINVEITEKAMDNIINAISIDYKMITKLRNKFRVELQRYAYIPRLLEMYKNPNFSELELVELLNQSFYEPFSTYYKEKYDIESNQFIEGFFKVITQFVFRGYDKKTLNNYVNLLKGVPTSDKTLKQILVPRDVVDGKTTFIYSVYSEKDKNNPPIFYLNNDLLYFNNEVIDKLKKYNAFELYDEHIELFEYLLEEKDFKMTLFSLVDRTEFLFKVDAKTLFMISGEQVDDEKREVYCTIKITEKETEYDNYIIGDDKIVYYTRSSLSKKGAIDKVNKFKDNDYKFMIAASFPHLKYENSTYFYMGKFPLGSISEVQESIDVSGKSRYNHKIIFKLDTKIPTELLQYKQS